MNPASLTRFSIENRSGGPIEQNAARVTGPDGDEKFNEFCRLLKKHTADEFHSVLKQKRTWQKQLGICLTDQSVPEAQWTDGLGTWLLSNGETAAFVAYLKMAGSESVSLSDKTGAETLLEAVLSTTPVTGLEVVLALNGEVQADREIIAPLAAAFRANNGLDTLQITCTENHPDVLAPLIEALCLVKNLRLGLLAMAFDSVVFILLSDLFLRNHEITSFALHHPFLGGKRPELEYMAAMNTFLGTLGTQNKLQYLRLDGVPQTGQKALAEFIAKSRAITSLHLSFHGNVCTPSLVKAFEKNTTIAELTVIVPNIEDGMLPVIGLIAGNKCHLTHFTLGTCCGRRDKEDLRFIAAMLKANTTLSCFKWDLITAGLFDLVVLGKALGENKTLDRITIINRQYAGNISELREMQSLLDAQIADFLIYLGRNRTLTDFAFFPMSSVSGQQRLSHPAIDTIIKRNLFYQNHACSEHFINGACCGFFEAVGGPSELGFQIAPYLSKPKPRIKAGSLALVNKASYKHALYERRKEGAKLMDKVLSPRMEKSEHAMTEMIALLGRLAALRQDYSLAQRREIAISPFMAHALVRMTDQDDFAYLVDRFSEVLGPERLNALLSSANKDKKQAAKASS